MVNRGEEARGNTGEGGEGRGEGREGEGVERGLIWRCGGERQGQTLYVQVIKSKKLTWKNILS